MRILAGIVLLAALVAVAPARTPTRKAWTVPATVAKGLMVHEWGVWRVHHDVDLANADMRAIWEGLPRFVYGQVSGRTLPKHWANVEIVDRPVIFFHAPQSLVVELRVDFPGGMPGVWWPGTETPAVHSGRVLGGAARAKPFRSLEWRLNLKTPPAQDGPRVLGLPPVDRGHWVKTLRAVKADDVFARVGERGFGYEREKFVYYDGLLPRGKWVAVTALKECVGLANQAKHPVFDVTVVDRRSPDQIRVARLARLEAGAEVKAVAFAAEDARNWPGAGVKTLTAQLKQAGLNEDEAGALVELWKKDLFETGGLTVFYRLPQSEYDRLLPLTMRPRPEHLVRVGLVCHPHCEPDLAQRVAALARELDDPSFKKREQAQKQLRALGQGAFVHLLKLRDRTPNVEVRKRIEQVLKIYDVRLTLPR